MQNQNPKKQKLSLDIDAIREKLATINRKIKRIEDDIRMSQNKDVRLVFEHDRSFSLRQSNKLGFKKDLNKNIEMSNDESKENIRFNNEVESKRENSNEEETESKRENTNEIESKLDNGDIILKINTEINYHETNGQNIDDSLTALKKQPEISKEDLISAKRYLFSARHLPSIFILKNSPKMIFFDDFQNAYREREITKYFRNIERINRRTIKQENATNEFGKSRLNRNLVWENSEFHITANETNNGFNAKNWKEWLIACSIERFLNRIGDANIPATTDANSNSKFRQNKAKSFEEKKRLYSLMKGGNSKIYSQINSFQTKKPAHGNKCSKQPSDLINNDENSK